MEQPPGFIAQGEIGKVCCLRKSLYCLKQSPVHGLVTSAKSLRNLACKRVYLTISSSTGTLVHVSFYW